MGTQQRQSEDSKSMKGPTPREQTESTRGAPYTIYVVLTGVLFLFLIVMGYIAWQSDWLPHRSNSISQVETQ